MLIRIEISSGVPLWQQIVMQVTRQVLSGAVANEERLPTVREMAAELRINPNTVSRAYQELERDGIVETRRGFGTFAIDVSARRLPGNWRTTLTERVDALLVEARHWRVPPDDLLALIEERQQAMVLAHPEKILLEEIATP